MADGEVDRGLARPGMIEVVDALEQPALLLAGDGLVRHANAAARQRLGVAAGAACREAVAGRHCATQCPLPEVLARHTARVCEVERDGFLLGLRLTAVAPDLCLGLLASAQPLRVLAAEGAALLHTILEASSDAMIACDLDHRVEFVNRALVERSGVPAAALIGRDYRAIWPTIKGIDWDELSRRVLERGEVVRVSNLRYESALGGSAWVDLTFAPRRDADGNLVGSITTAHYLTAERRLAARLEESERRFRELFEKAPVGIALLGPDARVRLANATAHQLLGVTDVVGRPVLELLGAAGRSAARSAWEAALRTGVRAEGGIEFALVRLDGRPLHVHVRTADIEYQGERCVQIVALDMTMLRQLQEQLAQAEKLGSLGTLAAGVAHEFNNVLTAIQGRAEILLRQGPSSLVSDCAHAIVRHSRRGADVIEQIASFAATRPVRPQPLRWEEVVDDVLQSLGAWLAEEHIQLERAYSATHGVLADPGQMQQVVLNLVQNARDALHPLGGGTIRLATRGGDGAVELEISDTGVGMDEAVRQRVFEPFFTTKTAGDRRGLATGLGLAIVYSIVRAHEGRIEVASAPGKGARFTISLPAHEGAAAQPGPDDRPPASSGPRPLRVLVVDDDADVTEMIALALETEGCTVAAYNRPQEAVELGAAAHFDVLIVDLMMPLLDGLGVLRQLRARGCRTPALVLTGRRGAADPAELALLGVRRFLEKPVGLATLLMAVADAAAGGPVQPAPPGPGPMG
jgi:PAS domain S-box-containing protein